MIYPFLLISAKVFNFRTHNPIGLNSCSFLTESFYGSFVVSLLGIYTLGFSNIIQWCLSIIPVIYVLGIFIILSSQHGRSFPQYIDAEFSSFCFPAKVILMLATGLVVEMVIFGLPWGHSLTTLALGSCKALSYYFIIQTVSPKGTQYLVYTDRY